MLRFATAFIMGFVLIVVEAMIVMYIKGYSEIYLENIQLLVGVWAMNFFLVFTILTDIKRRIEEREDSETQMS